MTAPDGNGNGDDMGAEEDEEDDEFKEDEVRDR